MQISKMTAEQIATKLVEKKRKEVDELDQEIKKLCTEKAESQVPSEVHKLFKVHSEFVETACEAYLDGHGLSREYIKLSKNVPAPNGYRVIIKMDAAFGKKILTLLNKKKDKNDATVKLKNEIIQALLTLRTSKQIIEKFPEAAALLPSQSKGLLPALNLKPIRDQLK